MESFDRNRVSQNRRVSEQVDGGKSVSFFNEPL
jgi:hypothetical protein